MEFKSSVQQQLLEKIKLYETRERQEHGRSRFDLESLAIEMVSVLRQHILELENKVAELETENRELREKKKAGE